MFKSTTKKLILVLFIVLSPALALASEPDWSGYEYLLQRYVHPGEKNNIALNLVDYQTLSSDQAWPQLLSRLANFDVNKLSSPSERLAFWINAYNILAIKVVLDHQPLQSIRDAGSFFSPVWNEPAGIVGSKMRTLNEVEHQILRPMKEPRIHFAIVCASVSCPDLHAMPYRAAELNKQLHDQAERFMTQPQKGVLIQADSIHVSKIFDWFKDDFQTQGGVMAFIRNYNKNINPAIQQPSYLNYDWSLNATTAMKNPG